MKKVFFVMAILLTGGVLFAQVDTIVVTDPTGEWNPPFWLSAGIGIVLALIPAIAWAKGKYRLGKFVSLTKIIADAIEDRNLDANELKAIAKAVKELVAKEEE